MSCLSSEIYDSLKLKHSLKLQPALRQLKAANQLPIETRGVVRLPISLGGRKFEHNFHVLAKSEADCLIGLDFLEDHQCDPLFSQKKLRVNDDTFVPLYHKVYTIQTDQVFRVASTDNVWIPAGHSMIIPAHIPGWKRPPIELAAVFEPHERFKVDKEVSADHVLFKFAEETIPVMVTNTGDEAVMIHKGTTLGQSELVATDEIQNISTLKSRKSPKLTDKKDAKYDLKLVKNSIDTGISQEAKAKFSKLINEFSDVFSKNEWDIGQCDVTAHKIQVEPGSRPIKLPNRRMPLHYKDDLQEKIDAFLEKKLITPCHSPYSAPAMLVPKKNGKLRLVIDYRQLNKQTIKSCWPIPSIEEIFDTLEGSEYFTTIDMSWGFYQLPMAEESQDYTAFSTPFGSFKWLRMPMGLTGSPNTFQSLMEQVLVGLTWKTTVPYLDDCIIFSSTAEEHIERLREVLERFRLANLKINPTKCEFFRTRVPFLGHIISKNGLEADPDKIAAVKKFPIPTNPTEVKSFLGLCSYYRRYVQNFAEIARPLHKASEVTKNFNWTPEAQDAFETLKSRLTTTPILAFPMMKEPFILYTDASLTAMGAVLSQVQDGQERAICYASKAFSKAQTRYSATKRELLAVVNFTRHFKHYLLGQKFTIITDHRALQWLHNFKDPDALTARWLEKLAAFDYEVVHRPGKSIGHADGLSRTPLRAFNAIATEDPAADAPEEDQEWPNRTNESPPDPKHFQYSEIQGDVLQSTDSIAHCISADFKLGAGIARSIKRRFPTQYPDKEAIASEVIWPQWIPESQSFVYHLITKVRYFHKPTYKALRLSLEAMKSHAESKKISRNSMPQIGCGLDKLHWRKVRKLIKEVFRPTNIEIIVFLKPLKEPPRASQNPVNSFDNAVAAETPNISETLTSLASAQRADPALKNLFQWVTRGTPPSTHELQGLP